MLLASGMALLHAPAALAQPAGLAQGRLAGSARLTVFGLDIYSARLWVAPGFQREQYAQHPFVLELAYLRSFTGRAIAERSLQEMRRVDSFTEAQGQQWLALLAQVLPDVKKGDRIAGSYQPGTGVQFLLNDRPLAEIKDPVFARLFMGIWLSPHTSEPAMREALLAQAGP